MREIDKNEYDHLHDCIVYLTWNTIKYNANQEVLEKVFNDLPYDLEIEAYTFGMNDTCWRDDFIEYYDGKYLLEINNEFIGLYDLEDIDNYIIEHNIDTNIDFVTKTQMKK